LHENQVVHHWHQWSNGGREEWLQPKSVLDRRTSQMAFQFKNNESEADYCSIRCDMFSGRMQ
jgi:hypothetical protein